MRMTMSQPQKKTRRQMLEEFVASKPGDAFARYGLAMECSNTGDAAAADENFKALMTSHPDYVAAYFQYGQFLAKSGRTNEARANTARASAAVPIAASSGRSHSARDAHECHRAKL